MRFFAFFRFFCGFYPYVVAVRKGLISLTFHDEKEALHTMHHTQVLLHPNSAKLIMIMVMDIPGFSGEIIGVKTAKKPEKNKKPHLNATPTL